MSRGGILTSASAAEAGSASFDLAAYQTRGTIHWKCSGSETASVAAVGVLYDGHAGCDIFPAGATVTGESEYVLSFEQSGYISITVSWSSLSGGTISTHYGLAGGDGI